MELVEGTTLEHAARGSRGRHGARPPGARRRPPRARGDALGRASGTSISSRRTSSCAATSRRCSSTSGSPAGTSAPGCATGAYGAPEVWGALEGRRDLSPMKADVYAFGCVAFEALTGRVLFQADSEMAQIAHARRPRRLSAAAARARRARRARAARRAALLDAAARSVAPPHGRDRCARSSRGIAPALRRRRPGRSTRLEPLDGMRMDDAPGSRTAATAWPAAAAAITGRARSTCSRPTRSASSPTRRRRDPAAPHGARRPPARLALREEHRRSLRRARRLGARALPVLDLRRAPRRLPHRRAGLARRASRREGSATWARASSSSGRAEAPSWQARRSSRDTATRRCDRAARSPRQDQAERRGAGVGTRAATAGADFDGGDSHAIELAHRPGVRRSRSRRLLVRRDGRIGDRRRGARRSDGALARRRSAAGVLSRPTAGRELAGHVGCDERVEAADHLVGDEDDRAGRRARTPAWRMTKSSVASSPATSSRFHG